MLSWQAVTRKMNMTSYKYGKIQKKSRTSRILMYANEY